MMKAIRKMRNTVTELRLWRTERKLLMQENANLREELDMERLKLRRANCIIDAEKTLRQLRDDALDGVTLDNVRLANELEEAKTENQHLNDLLQCVTADWGAMYAEAAELRKKVQRKEDGAYRLWAERTLLLAALMNERPEEAARYYVEE